MYNRLGESKPRVVSRVYRKQTNKILNMINGDNVMVNHLYANSVVKSK